MFIREVIAEYILSMISEAHYPSVSENKVNDEQEYGGLTDKDDLGYQGDLGGPFMDEVQKALKITHTGDCIHEDPAGQDQSFCVLHENDWAGELGLK